MSGRTKVILIALVGLLLVAFLGARVVFSRFVNSQEFRTTVRGTIAGSLQDVIPGVKVDVAGSEAAGLFAIQLRDLAIAKGNHGIKIRRLRVDPGLLRALFSSNVPFSIEAAVEVGAAVTAVGQMPRAWLFGDVRAAGPLSVNGRLTGFDALTIANLLLPGKPNDQFQFAGGKLEGDFVVEHASKNGRATFDGKLINAEWRARALGNRPITVASIPLAVEFTGGEVKLNKPFVFTTPIGRVTITGSVKTAAATQWDLVVDPQNNPILRMGMARLFRCASVPGGGPLKVVGPVGAPNCE